ncbi:MAG: glycoside hydrolase family 36 protein [Kiritimatiellia bacterium]
MMLILAALSSMFSFGEVEVDCAQPGDWKIDLERELAADGAEIARIALTAPTAAKPPKFSVKFAVPQVDIGYRWTVNDVNFQLPPNWGGAVHTEFANNMPLYVFFNGNDTSRFAVAASEASRPVDFSGGVREEGSMLECRFTYFDSVKAPLTHYETKIRIDSQTKPLCAAVAAGARWIEQTGGYTPCATPAAALDPLYSTWYNFHQDVTDKAVEAELALAARLGMKTVILDDGWQTDDTNRGYAFCGDWKVSPRRFPDMRAHVEKVHGMGLKYMVWYSVPFVGHKSQNFSRFRGKYLNEDCGMGTAVLDPRFPEVRKFLIDTYVQAMKDWNLDGFKLDFIDAFRFKGWAGDPAEKDGYAGRDILSVPLAVDRLMQDVRAALVAIKPEVLLEFRQSYVGPGVRQIGNMLRVGDCPGDMRRNRLAIANLRLASGESAVHADMLEWHFKEPAEKSALYILNSIFGVVQYSVMLREAPKDHLAMIEHWIKFSQEHRKTLLQGDFRPHHPELQYPLIEAESEVERIIAVYDDGRLVDCGAADKPVYVLNASGTDRLALRLAGAVKITAYDTFGQTVGRLFDARAGLEEVKCPSAGYVKIEK